MENSIDEITKETGRVEAFSDGVFAIASTLLVLDIHFTPSKGQTLWDAVAIQWPTLLAFVISFATIGVMWINHHRLFTHIKKVDTGLLVLNLALLLVIVFIPVPTALLAEFLTNPQSNNVAAALYTGTFLCMACFFTMLWLYASHENKLLGGHMDHVGIQRITAQYQLGPVFYLVALGVAFVSVPLTIILNILYAIMFVLPTWNFKKRNPTLSNLSEVQ
ncbi:TMEM175 family protein [Dictyobacter arantiisoli]|uniref:DUF1211 domain-containing membrane protein n=1 Tax=Dictyobacter arantiisoli TaxID=2014874 RepID=A0A5A5TEE9_9CHLR|nr:TMEM175 family protein [Dictyobacter arantiisoli]GCF09453.1 hypothetical protein KDI_30170 [Dictyobacter arantiisoli]